MKKILLATIALIAISIAGNAQGGFRLGIKGGFNLNQIEGQSFDNGFTYGYHLGGFAEVDFNKKIGIQPEVLFNQTNTKVASGFSSLYPGITNPNYSEDVRLNYLSIPILLRYNVGSMVTLLAGPQFGILINQHENLMQNGQDAFAKGDFGMVGGLQLNLSMLRIYGRYNIGLKNINDIGQQDKWTNQQIQLGVGLRL